MISPMVIDEVRRLLNEQKLSQRTIARRVGVSRGTVNAIWLGKRSDRDRRCRTDGDDSLFDSSPPQRCPGCGGLVHMPCLLCRIRSLRDKRRPSRAMARPRRG